jgi:hypothetical protein
MVILPVPKSRGSRIRSEYLQKALRKINLPEDTVFLAGYDFGMHKGKNHVQSICLQIGHDPEM